MAGDEITYKLLVLGDSNVGKTCFIHRYCDHIFYETYISTIGIDCKQKSVTVDDQAVRLRIWDTAGQERFRTLTTAYYRGAQGIILVYDITNEDSFGHLAYWLKNIDDMASPDICKVLVGNKCDLVNDRQVPTDKAQNLARNFDVPFYETSCKTNVNIDEAFQCLAKNIKQVAESKHVEHPSLKRTHSWHKEAFKKPQWCTC